MGGRTTSAGGTLGEGGSGSGGSTAGTNTGGSNRDAGTAGGAAGTGAGDDAGAGGRIVADGAAAADAPLTDARPGSTGGTGTGGTLGTGGATSAGGRTGTGGSATGGATSGGGTGGGQGSTPITVWMAGDSTMAGDTCAGGGWGDQLGSLFNGNVKIDNRSVAGRSIQTWLYEKNVSSTKGSDGECTLTATTYSANWTAMLDATTGMKKGDYLIIEFGINDGDSACPRHVGTTLFQTYLGTMAKAAKDRGAQAIFLTSTSYIECSGQTATANRGFRTETKAAGTTNGVPVIDMSALSAAMYTKQGLCPNSADYTSTTSKVGVFFCNDHTHFAEPGALEIARVAATAVRDQGIGLAAYLK
jgi:lysophospholipase L1-like esterase